MQHLRIGLPAQQTRIGQIIFVYLAAAAVPSRFGTSTWPKTAMTGVPPKSLLV
jgi:hypothetical protein